MGQLAARIVPVTLFQQNCTILFDEETREAVVVDPGGDVPDILAALDAEALSVSSLWLTHGHLDHAAGAMDLKDALGNVPLIGPHEADKPLLAHLADQARMFGVPGVVREPVPDRFLVEGDTVAVGAHPFKVLHTPGHAPGHVVFVNEAARFAHVGDVLFQGSVGRTDLPGGDHAALLRSIETKLLPLGDDVSFLCGHGPGSTIGAERRSNPFLAGMRA